jgi:hypothetical protein
MHVTVSSYCSCCAFWPTYHGRPPLLLMKDNVFKGNYGPAGLFITNYNSVEEEDDSAKRETNSFCADPDAGVMKIFSQITNLRPDVLLPIIRRCLDLWRDLVPPAQQSLLHGDDITALVLKGVNVYTRIKMQGITNARRKGLNSSNHDHKETTHIFDTQKNVNIRISKALGDEEDERLDDAPKTIATFLKIIAVVQPAIVATGEQYHSCKELFHSLSATHTSSLALCHRYKKVCGTTTGNTSDSRAPTPLLDQNNLWSEGFPFQMLELDTSDIHFIFVEEIEAIVNIIPVQDKMNVATSEPSRLCFKLPDVHA